jgi:peptidoglycan/xylan/chitin deacetylase (PgdA/CDA1 family)
VHDALLWSRRLARSVFARTVGRALPVERHLVLGYHRVVERFEWEAPLTLPASLVSRKMLERHLDFIGRDREFVSLDELGERLAEGHRSRRPLAAVTFDDGYRDMYEHAFPILTRKGIPCAVFLVTELVGTNRLQTHDRLHSLLRLALRAWKPPLPTLRDRLIAASLPEAPSLTLPAHPDPFFCTRALLVGLSSRSLAELIRHLELEFGAECLIPDGFLPMTWEMVSELHGAGVTIGSHTQSHALLTNESSSRVHEEVIESRRTLERRLGAPILHFAYPDGRFNQTAIEAVRTAGYRFGYTTCRHRDPRHSLLTIPRRVLWEHSAVDTRGRFAPELLRHLAQPWVLGRRTCSWQSHA